MKKRILSMLLILVLAVVSTGVVVMAEETEYNLSKKYVRFIGRNEVNETHGFAINWPGSGFEFKFTGTSADVYVNYMTSGVYFNVIIDGGEPNRISLATGWNNIATELTEEEHTIKFLRSSECNNGLSYFGKIKVNGTVPVPTVAGRRKMEFYGDSFTVGYGNLAAEGESKNAANTDNYYSYASIAARALGAEANLIARSGRGIAINNSGSLTNTLPMISKYCDVPDSAGEHELWNHSKFIPQVVVVFLGINDWVGDSESGVENPTELVTNTYRDFIKELRGYYPKANILLCSRPSKCYQGAVDTVFNELSQTDSRLHRFYFDPCTATGIAGHPTKAEHEVLAQQLVEKINSIEHVWQDEEILEAVSYKTDVVVNGKVPYEYGNKPVTLILKKKNWSLDDVLNWNTNIAYMEEKEIDDEGNYNFEFSIDENIGDYELIMNQGGKVVNGTVVSALAKNQLVTAKIELTQNDTKVDLAAEIVNKYGFDGINYNMYLAAYKEDGTLVDVKMTTLKKLGETTNTESEYFDVDSSISYVRAYIWDETMIPLSDDEGLSLNFELQEAL